MTDADTVWCPSCREDLDVGEAGSVVSFAPQGLQIDTDGGVTFSDPSETYLDYSHLACGTSVRFDLIGAYQDLSKPYEHMIEVDIAGGESPVLMLGPSIVTAEPRLGRGGDGLVLDDEAHRKLTETHETLKRLRDEAFGKIHLKGEGT